MEAVLLFIPPRSHLINVSATVAAAHLRMFGALQKHCDLGLAVFSTNCI